MNHSARENRARITEIFSSIQGEGSRMGERHLFIRFETCHLECVYCDERKKRGKKVTLDAVLRKVDALEKKNGPHAYVSLTGGEPLLEGTFLGPLCRALKKRKYKILLETNGILGGAFARIRKYCDLVAMDVKLSSVSGQKDFLKEHAGFLVKTRGRETYIKIVVSGAVDQKEYVRHLRMIAKVAPQTPVFLQPVSQRGAALPASKLLMRMIQFQKIGQKYLPSVRLGIQLHKIFKIR